MQSQRTGAGRIATMAALLAFAAPLAAAEMTDLGPLPEVKVHEARAALGKRLFFDKRLSGDAAISCATCHRPENGYSHPDALSPGYPGNGHFRNSPGLINTVQKKAWMHDGRLGTNLNDVTRGMLTEDYIMNMDMRIMQERIKQDPTYVQMFKDAGYGEPSNGGVRNAIPEYLKTLTSRNAPFDTGTMSDSAKRGEALFRGKAGCTSCHSGPMLSDGKAHNIGVPENFQVFRDPLRHQAFIAYNMFMGTPDYMGLKRDMGAWVRNRAVGAGDRLKGAFMTPSLRELKQTAPYMHNGMLATLMDVVEFYNQGGGKRKEADLAELRLTTAEKRDLVAFLEALSGDPLTGPEHVWTEAYPEEYPVIANWREVSN